MASKAISTSGRELTRAPKRDALKTFGQRLRFARVSCSLSQSELARAIAKAANTKTTKSMVSQWEGGNVKLPQFSTMLAISAVTMFASQWLLDGTGPERASIKPTAKDGNLDVWIKRAATIAATQHKTPGAIGNATVQVFAALRDDPTTPDSALQRIAQLATPRSK